MKEPQVFELGMDALLRAAGTSLSPPCTERLLAASFDVTQRLQPAYPASVWAEVLKILGEESYRGCEPQEAYRRLGARSVSAFVEGSTGAAMLALRVIGPSRIIGRLTKSMLMGCNYLEIEVTQVGPTTFDIWLNEVMGVQGFYQGMLEAGMGLVGAPGLQIEIASCDSHQCTYRASWEPT